MCQELRRARADARLVHVAAAALGLAVLFQYPPTAYLVLKLSGAAYLIYLGVHYFVQKLITRSRPMPAIEIQRTQPVLIGIVSLVVAADVLIHFNAWEAGFASAAA